MQGPSIEQLDLLGGQWRSIRRQKQIELSLLKLYRRTGAHAAAAEQYAHYAAVLRNDLGIEPPPLDSL